MVTIGLLVALWSGLVDVFGGADRNQTVFDLTSLAHTAAPWLLAFGILSAVSAGLAIAVVRRITYAQTAMLATLSAHALVPVPMRPDLGI